MKKLTVWLFALTAFLFGCAPQKDGSSSAQTAPAPAPPPALKAPLRILSGSENKVLKPLLDQFTRETGIPVQLEEKGSVDIMMLLQQSTLGYHAVWPASSVWLDISGNKSLGERVSIYRTPVVLGIRQSVADKLGVRNSEATLQDVQTWLESGALNLISSNPTQSNSGAMGYLGMLHFFIGKDEPFQVADLDNPAVHEKVRKIFSKVKRTVGSSNWLKDLYLSSTFYNAMFNYESTILELNQTLQSQGQEPLQIVYLQGATAMADSPLTNYKSKDDRSADVKKLQAFLTTPAAQAQLSAMGRRTGVTNVAAGVSSDRVLQAFPMPTADAIRKALALYQTELKRATLTVYVLDYSGSMHSNGGEEQLSQAMHLLLSPEEAEPYLLMTGRKDITWVIPFDGKPRGLLEANGSAEKDLTTLRDSLLKNQASGGTDFYAAIRMALDRMAAMPDLEDYQVSVLLMTDGESQGDPASFARRYTETRLSVPIYSIMFGSADPRQLNDLAKISKGRVFDGRKNLIQALREAKSYN